MSQVVATTIAPSRDAPYFRVASDVVVRPALRIREMECRAGSLDWGAGCWFRMDDRVLGMLPNLLSSEGGTIMFLFVVEVPQAMPLDAELPTDIDVGERALRHAENAARQALPSRNTSIVTELLQARAVGPAIVDEAIRRDAEAIVDDSGDSSSTRPAHVRRND